MDNLQKYNKIIMETFEVSEDILQELKYQSVDSWDSVGHMLLVASLEEQFEITMDTDDIIEFSSYKKGLEILEKNYNIKF